MLDAASTKQQMTRAFVRQALQQLPHGFDALDTCLLHHASLVNDAYDVWYRAFAQAVRVSILLPSPNLQQSHYEKGAAGEIPLQP